MFAELRVLGVRILGSLLVLTLSPVSLYAEGTVYLEHSTAGVDALPIGLVNFAARDGASAETGQLISRVLQQDLLFTGRFKPLVQDRFDSIFWLRENVPAFVHGNYRRSTDGAFVLECYLSDTRNMELLTGNTYTVTKKELRQALHHFADKISSRFFGEYGVASTFLTYSDKSEGNKNIMVSDYDGANPRRVTRGKGIDVMPVWGHDDSYLIFTSFRDGRAGLYRQELASGKVRRLFKNLPQIFAPAVDPKGRWVAFTVGSTGGSDLYRGDLDGKNSTKLTYHWATETSAEFSPSGNEIVYSSDRGGSPQLYLMDRDGGDVRRLSYRGRYNESPAWSPKGDRIAFCRMDQGKLNIYVMDLDGSNLQQLTTDAGNNESPSWSPDGRLIAFSSDRDGSSKIYLMREDGTAVTRISKGLGSHSSPAWSHYPPTHRSEP